jgi:hypothetical protein
MARHGIPTPLPGRRWLDDLGRSLRHRQLRARAGAAVLDAALAQLEAAEVEGLALPDVAVGDGALHLCFAADSHGVERILSLSWSADRPHLLAWSVISGYRDGTTSEDEGKARGVGRVDRIRSLLGWLRGPAAGGDEA